MDGLRQHRVATLWASDGIDWPSFGSGAHICFRNDNTLESNATTIGNTAGAGNVIFFDIPENIDYCLIEWRGSVVSITTGGSPAGDSTVRAAIVGLPHVAESTLATFPALRTHPLESKAYPLGMADAWFADGLGGQAQFVSPTPPFFGMWCGASFTTAVVPNGWPFNGNSITPGDEWSIQFPIGKLRDGSMLSVSGYRRVGLTMKSVNPALAAGNPSAFRIQGRLLAHLYEYRKRR